MEDRQSQHTKSFDKERRKSQVSNILGYSVIALLFLILAMILSGDRFQWALSYLGLQGIENTPSGIYIDCSLKENQTKRYCLTRKPKADVQWRNMRNDNGKGVTFSLYGD